VFCSKHPELSKHFLHAHAAIFTSAASSTLGCCSIGRHAAASEAASHRSSSSNKPSVRQVSPQQAADTVYDTNQPRSITAILVDRAHGKTVGQRIKDKEFCDIVYVAELLLQLVPVLAVLQQELGFCHDDLRLDNILETWGDDSPLEQQYRAHSQLHGQHSTPAQHSGAQQQQQLTSSAAHLQPSLYPAVRYGPAAAAAAPAGDAAAASSSTAAQGAGAGKVTFQLFDFGLSMVNPDKYSLGQQARSSPQEKQEALRRLHEQGEGFTVRCLGAQQHVGSGCGVLHCCVAPEQSLPHVAKASVMGKRCQVPVTECWGVAAAAHY
jgi:hypothetical protein